MSEDFPSGKHAGEGRVITCEYDGFYLVNVYVPNSKGDLSRLGYRYESWDPDLKDYLIELRAKKPVILCGDLNVAHREIDLANPKTNRKKPFLRLEREGISNLLLRAFSIPFFACIPISKTHTPGGPIGRCPGKKCWLADRLFVVSDDLATSVRDATILAQVEGSDHCRLVYPSPRVGFHEYFPRIPFELYGRVLELARKGWGSTHPKPMVGALIVEKVEVVAQGFHQKSGGPHAEVEALNSLGRQPSPDASIIISLEPCSTHGKTPPCTDAILHSGIQTVYVAALDPNPRHAGNGIEILREKGLNVELASPDVQERAGRLNFIFNHNMQTGRPMIALKLAESANGKLADEAGRPSRVTESEARADMMHWRRLFPAICVVERYLRIT